MGFDVSNMYSKNELTDWCNENSKIKYLEEIPKYFNEKKNMK